MHHYINIIGSNTWTSDPIRYGTFTTEEWECPSIDTISKLINNENKMFNEFQKSLVDADTAKLVEAGYVDAYLNLTTNGQQKLWSIILEDNKEALLKAADVIIASKKK